jgi:hypothetical protein
MIVLISCCGPKLDRPAPARLLYRSELFRSSMAWATSRRARIYILSAKYGLIGPDDVVAPYDRQLADMSKEGLELWAKAVAKKVDSLPAGRTVLLAGRLYGSFESHCSRVVEKPLEHLKIGSRLRWLKENTL